MAQRSLNKVMLLGNLGRDPEVRYTSSGRAVATFTLATSQRWKDQEGNEQEKTEWHRIVAWGRLGEVCGEFLSKGRQVFIEGRIQSREWADQEGVKRTTVEIIANDMIMLGGAPGAQHSGYRGEGGPGRTQDRKPPARSPEGPDTASYQPPPPEDDIPF
jgi:single-strand DNA-binding protein